MSPAKYVELYNKYKKKLSDKSANKWSSYQIQMNPEISNFRKKNSRPFRTTKLGNPVDQFSKAMNEEIQNMGNNMEDNDIDAEN